MNIWSWWELQHGCCWQKISQVSRLMNWPSVGTRTSLFLIQSTWSKNLYWILGSSMVIKQVNSEAVINISDFCCIQGDKRCWLCIGPALTVRRSVLRLRRTTFTGRRSWAEYSWCEPHGPSTSCRMLSYLLSNQYQSPFSKECDTVPIKTAQASECLSWVPSPTIRQRRN